MTDAIRPSGKVVKLTAAEADITVPRALWVGTGGTATMTDAEGNVLTDFPLKEGLVPIRIKRLSTLTTAADVWGLY